jgi:hypothetical protein
MGKLPLAFMMNLCYQHFGGTYCLHHQDQYVSQNDGNGLQDYTASQIRSNAMVSLTAQYLLLISILACMMNYGYESQIFFFYWSVIDY